MTSPQTDLFGAGPALPHGFRYEAALITPAAEAALVEQLRALPLRDFEFHGYTGKRRVVSFGWHYDFNESVLRKTDDMPSFLHGRAAVDVPAEWRRPHRVGARHSAGGRAALLRHLPQPARGPHSPFTSATASSMTSMSRESARTS
jgi:hypothetical protein